MSGGWRVHWQDYTGHRIGGGAPESQFRDFPDRVQANAYRDTLRQQNRPDLVVTVAPAPLPKPDRARRRG